MTGKEHVPIVQIHGGIFVTIGSLEGANEQGVPSMSNWKTQKVKVTFCSSPTYPPKMKDNVTHGIIYISDSEKGKNNLIILFGIFFV